MQIDWWTLALQTINFLVVVWLLGRFLYRPVRRVIEAREAADAAARDEAARALAEAQATRAEYERRLAELESDLHERAARLHAENAAEREAILAAARDEAARITAEARARVARERQEAFVGLRDQIATLAAAMARRALAEPLAGIDDVARHIDALPEAERHDLAADLRADGAGLTVVTAAPLPDEDRARWTAMLRDRFGADTPVGFAEGSDLIAGVDLHFPHATMRFSLADRLQRIATEIEAGQ